MKYMLLIYNEPANWPGDAASGEQLMKAYVAFSESIAKSGEMVAGDPVQGIETATSVRVRDGKRTTTDGPFAETKEHLGGYYIVDVADLDRALELAAQIPDAHSGVIEVRPLAEFPAV